MDETLSATFSRTVKTYAVLDYNQKEIGPEYHDHAPENVTVDIAELGLSSAADVHEYVRTNKRYEAYRTYQVSTVVTDGIAHTSKQYNETPKVWFGQVVAAEDLKVSHPKKDGKGNLHMVDGTYAEFNPWAKGRFFIRTHGFTTKMLEPDELVYSKATNEPLWPKTNQQPAPQPHA